MKKIHGKMYMKYKIIFTKCIWSFYEKSSSNDINLNFSNRYTGKKLKLHQILAFIQSFLDWLYYKVQYNKI